MTTRVALVGATGRMGGLIGRLIDDSDDFEVTARLSSADPLEKIAGVDIVVDVTSPKASPAVVEYAITHGHNVLVGTSGWSADRIAALEAKIGGNLDVGVLIVPNFSLGSVLSTIFAGIAGRFYDSVEIVESHHAAKVDSPSGTAVRTAEHIAQQRVGHDSLEAPHVDQPARGQVVAGIPVHSLRMRGVVAQQDIIFGGNGEQLVLRHETLSPTAYEAGIMRALRALGDIRGVVVGLDKLVDLRSEDGIA